LQLQQQDLSQPPQHQEIYYPRYRSESVLVVVVAAPFPLCVFGRPPRLFVLPLRERERGVLRHLELDWLEIMRCLVRCGKGRRILGLRCGDLDAVLGDGGLFLLGWALSLLVSVLLRYWLGLDLDLVLCLLHLLYFLVVGGGDMGGEERPSMLASQPGWEVMVVFLFCGFGGVCACACDLGEMEAGDRGSG